MLGFLLLRGLFSGWDLVNDFSVPKIVKWPIDLAIYIVPGTIALRRIRSRYMLPAALLVLFYLAVSLAFGVLHQNSRFGIEKSISLTLINTVEILSMIAVCAALIRGDLVIPDRLLDAFARFGLAYVGSAMVIGAYLTYKVTQGGDLPTVAGQFFFVSPITLRMSATFSEPSYLGFYAGFCALFYHSRYPGAVSISFIVVCGGVLYFLVGAKFAIIAYPLSIILGPLVRRASLQSVRIVFYGMFAGLFIATCFGLDEYIYRHWIGDIEYENQSTFITRFAYIFSSLRHLMFYPIGTGFGGWMFTLPEEMATTINMTHGLGNDEIIDQVVTGFNFAPKDSLSMALLIAGWLGLAGFIESFLLLLSIGGRVRSIAPTIVLYILLSIAVYVNAVAVPMFFATIAFLIGNLRSLHSQIIIRKVPMPTTRTKAA